MQMEGNVFLKGAKPSKFEKDPVVKPDFDPAIRLGEEADGFYLEMKYDPAWRHGPHAPTRDEQTAGPGSHPECCPTNNPMAHRFSHQHRLLRPEQERNKTHAPDRSKTPAGGA